VNSSEFSWNFIGSRQVLSVFDKVWKRWRDHRKKQKKSFENNENLLKFYKLWKKFKVLRWSRVRLFMRLVVYTRVDFKSGQRYQITNTNSMSRCPELDSSVQNYSLVRILPRHVWSFLSCLLTMPRKDGYLYWKIFTFTNIIIWRNYSVLCIKKDNFFLFYNLIIYYY